MIGCLRTYFTNPHYFIARNANRVFEPIAIPKLKERHIQTYVGWVQHTVICYLIKKTSKVFDVVHSDLVILFRYAPYSSAAPRVVIRLFDENHTVSKAATPPLYKES